MWENTKNPLAGLRRLNGRLLPFVSMRETPEQLDLDSVAVESQEGRPPSIGTGFQEKVAEVGGDEAFGRRSFVG